MNNIAPQPTTSSIDLTTLSKKYFTLLYTLLQPLAVCCCCALTSPTSVKQAKRQRKPRATNADYEPLCLRAFVFLLLLAAAATLPWINQKYTRCLLLRYQYCRLCRYIAERIPQSLTARSKNSSHTKLCFFFLLFLFTCITKHVCVARREMSERICSNNKQRSVDCCDDTMTIGFNRLH